MVPTTSTTDATNSTPPVTEMATVFMTVQFAVDEELNDLSCKQGKALIEQQVNNRVS